MAEHALTYFTILAIVCNVSVVAALAAIVLLVPRMNRRRPAHRAELAPLRARLSVVTARPAAPRRAAAPAARAA